MTPFPLPISTLFGHWGAYVLYLVIGFGFGYALEISGFGQSTKLAAQFYFKDMTVLKVMFTAIIVAMLGIFFTSALGLLDYNLVWVNPTYLWPGIIGGLIMGVGFIVGGFCPGTSLVAAATAKIDGVFFLMGVFFGIFLFGESVSLFEPFFYSSFMGRFTLMQLFNVPTGVVVLGVVLMALFMFWGGEQLERIFGKMDPSKAPKWRYGAAGSLVFLGATVLLIGQPTAADRWTKLAPEKESALAERAVQVHPGEVLDLKADPRLQVMILDVRSESDYNTFHILDSVHLPAEAVDEALPDLLQAPANTVFFVVGNDEAAATEVWKRLISESLPNVYIIEGGINNWLALFSDETFLAENCLPSPAEDQLGYVFPAALGDRLPAANPNHGAFHFEYTPKVELQQKRGASGGGCG